MSIIYDALKKIEKTIDSGAQKSTANKSLPGNKIILTFLSLIIIAAAFFLGNTIFHVKKEPLSSSQPSLPAKVILPAQEENPQPKTEEAPAPAPLPPETKKEPQVALVLSGIFSSQNERYALINNQIVKIGDVISGATLKQIGTEEVELDREGEAIKLTTRSR